MTNTWNLPDPDKKGFIEDRESGQVLTMLHDSSTDVNVVLEEKAISASERQTWMRSLDTGGFFTITNPMSGKILLAESATLVTAKGESNHDF